MAQPQPNFGAGGNSTTTYAGEFAGEYIKGALLSGETLANGLINIKPNVKLKSVIKTYADTTPIVDATCDFTDNADLALNERILEPKEFQLNQIFCKDEFQKDWEAISMGYSAFDSLPPKFSDFMIATASERVAQFVEQQIWSGAGGANSFEGFTSLLTNDGGIDVAAAAGGVDASNVIDEMGKIADSIPSAVYAKEDLHIYVSSNIARAYVRALGGFAAAGVGANGFNNQGTMWYSSGNLTFDGIKVVVAQGLANNTAVAAQKSNLYYGTGLLNDTNTVKVIDTSETLGDQNVRVVMRFTSGVIHGIRSDIKLYA